MLTFTIKIFSLELLVAFKKSNPWTVTMVYFFKMTTN